MSAITLVLDNVRSAQNVGAIVRSCASFGIKNIIACGITPYPKLAGDKRLPHVAERASVQIAKTALGGEKYVTFEHYDQTKTALAELRRRKHHIYAVEQDPRSIPLDTCRPKLPAAIVFGNEVSGISKSVLARSDKIIEIPHTGPKASLNVAVAAGIILYKACS